MLQHLSAKTDVSTHCPTFVAKAAATDVAKAAISSENPAAELPLAAGLSSGTRMDQMVPSQVMASLMTFVSVPGQTRAETNGTSLT